MTSRPRFRRRAPLLLSFALVLVAGPVALPVAAVGSPPIVASDAWVRAAPNVQMNTAAYMRLRNTSSADVAVVGVTSPAARVAELHQMREDNGVMRMRRVDRLVVPAQGTLTLEPGGLHVMLFQLTAPLEPGATITLLLTLADGSTVNVAAQVRALK